MPFDPRDRNILALMPLHYARWMEAVMRDIDQAKRALREREQTPRKEPKPEQQPRR